jgi:hypothetical protein
VQKRLIDGWESEKAGRGGQCSRRGGRREDLDSRDSVSASTSDLDALAAAICGEQWVARHQIVMNQRFADVSVVSEHGKARRPKRPEAFLQELAGTKASPTQGQTIESGVADMQVILEHRGVEATR